MNSLHPTRSIVRVPNFVLVALLMVLFVWIASPLPYGSASSVTDPATNALPGGGVVRKLPNGDALTQLPNGTEIITRPDGSSTERRKDGTTIVFNKATSTTTTTYPSGASLEIQHGSGMVTMKMSDGTTTTTKRDGSSTTQRPNGERVEILPNGRTIRTFPDGSVSIRDADGTSIHLQPYLGTVIYPGGRQTFFDPANGSPKGLIPPLPPELFARYQQNSPKTGSIVVPGQSPGGTTITGPGVGTSIGTPAPGGTSIIPGASPLTGAHIAGTSTLQPGSITTLPGGARLERRADGTTVTTYPEGTTVTKYPDGRTHQKNPLNAGAAGSLPDGGIYVRLADGTRIEHRGDGTTVTTYPEGTTLTKYSDGRTHQKNPLNAGAAGSLPDGGIYVRLADDTRIEHYPDGTTITDDPKTGTRTIRKVDGSSTTSPLSEAKPAIPLVQPLSTGPVGMQKSSSTNPDVAKAPVPGGSIPVPYPNSNFQIQLGGLPTKSLTKIEVPSTTQKTSANPAPAPTTPQRALGVVPRAVESEPSDNSLPMLTLENATNFAAMRSRSVTVPAGEYAVVIHDRQLRLTQPDGGPPSFTVASRPATYEGRLEGTALLWLPTEQQDAQLLLVLDPNGEARYTIVNGETVRTRGLATPRQFLLPGTGLLRLTPLPVPKAKAQQPSSPKAPLRIVTCGLPLPSPGRPAQLQDKQPVRDNDCRDLNPGTLHVVVGNMLGMRSQVVVEDRTADPQRAFGVVPRTVDEKGGEPHNETVDTTPEMEKKP